MPEILGRTTVFKAKKLANGKVVCIDVDELRETTKVVTAQDYDLAKSLGWCDSPKEALDRFEAEECQRGEDAAVRAYDDRRLSEQAKSEAERVESTTVRHIAEIPEAPRKRGRPKKLVQ
jgi:hypothetical protein